MPTSKAPAPIKRKVVLAYLLEKCVSRVVYRYVARVAKALVVSGPIAIFYAGHGKS